MITGMKHLVRSREKCSGGDDGSALVVALVVLTVVSLAASAMIGLADTTLRAGNKGLRPARTQIFAADGAVDAAIRRIVNDEGIAQYPATDCGLDVPADAALGTPAVEVVCVPQVGSRTDTAAPVGQEQFPSQTILTLGRRANWPGNGDRFWPFNWNLISGPPSSDPSYGVEPGILFRASVLGSASPITIAGDLFSNSTITAEGGAVTDLDGDIAARGACSASVTALSGIKACSIGYGDDGLGADPLYAHRGQTEGFPQLRSVPAQCTGATLQTFEPGFYNDSAALSRLFRDSSCNDKDFWFKPGLYYFDFRNTDTPPACNVSGSPVNQVHQWCIDSAAHTSPTRPHIVGGTPVAGWSPDGAQGAVTLEDPVDAGVAASPAGAWSGVPAGPKVIDGTSASTAWAPASLDTPATVISSPAGAWAAIPGGAQTIGDGTSAQTSWGDVSLTGLSAAGSESCGWFCADFAPLTGARAIGDGSIATGSLGFFGGTLHAITSQYATNLSASATVAQVTVTVRHRRTGNPNGAQASTIEVVNGEGTTCGTVGVGTPTHGVWTTTTTADLFPSCLNTPARVNAMKVHYRASRSVFSSATADFDLDGVEVNVSATDGGARSLTMTAYDASAIPPDVSTVDSLTLDVASSATGADRSVSLFNGSGASCGTWALSGASESITVPTTCMASSADLVGARSVVTVSPTGASGSASVDGSRLDVTYTPSARTVVLSQLQGSPSAVPATAVSVDAVDLDLSGAVSGATGTFSLYPGGGGGACGTWPASATTVPGLAGCLGTAAKVNGAFVVYSVSPTATSGNGSLDGARLRVDYTDSPARFEFPGMCDPNEPGVQFIFGGDSHLYLPNGTFELCAGPNPPGTLTNQRIAMYGLRPVDPLKPTSAPAAAGWSDASNAFSIGESPTTLDATTAFPAVAFGTVDQVSPVRPITLSGFGGGVSIPAGASIKRVYAMVAHGQSAVGLTAPRLKVWNGAGALCSETSGEGYALNLHNELLSAFTRRYEAVDLTGCFADPDPNVAVGRLNGQGLAVEFDAKPTTGSFLGIPGTFWQLESTSRLDGVQLMIELQATSPTAAAYIPQNGCVAGLSSYPNYWDGYADPDCALFKWDGIGLLSSSPRGQVSIHGTVYAPGGALDIDDEGPPCQSGWLCAPGSYVGVDYPIVDRGVVARHVRFKALKTKSGYDGPIFSCGECGATVTGPADVVLQARVDGRTIVEARVQIPNQLTDPGASPEIERWAVDP